MFDGDGDFTFEHQFEDDGEMGVDLFNASVAPTEALLAGDSTHDKSFDRDWFMRRMSIGSEGPRARSNTTEWQMQAQGIDSVKIGADIFSHGDWGDNLHGEVDLSAYESHAAQLQNSAAGNKGSQQMLRFNKVCFRGSHLQFVVA